MIISICVTSDVHGRMDRLEKLAPLLRQKQPDILIDNGDLLQGGMLSYYVDYIKPQQHPMLDVVNRIGYDCAIFGNHEFNYPLEQVRARQNACSFPWISANIGNFAKPYLIKDVRGKRVAIVGVTTHFTPLWDEHGYTAPIAFSNALEAARYWVDYVHQHERSDYIILCYHGGFTADVHTGATFAADNGENEANAMLTIPHIDALITGHQHLQIATIVNGIPVVQPGANGLCFGYITIGDETTCELVMNDYVDEHFPPVVDQWLNEKIGHCAIDMTYSGLLQSRINKPLFVDFLHQVMTTATAAELSVVELMFHDNGGLSGDVTNGDVLRNISRPNTLKVVTLTGSDIVAALEQCAAVFALDANGNIDFSYNVHWHEPQPYIYDYWCGMSYTISVGKPLGNRVSNIFIGDQPIQLHKKYHVAMNSYRATGADFPMLRGKPFVQQTSTLFPTLILQHIRNYGFQVQQLGQISVIR